VTDGEIAVANNESVRHRAWGRFFDDPLREGAAETVIESEKIALQFSGDLFALDRMKGMLRTLAGAAAPSPRSALLTAEVLSVAHRFADARRYLEDAQADGTLAPEIKRLSMVIDQACGDNHAALLEQRRADAMTGKRPQDMVALGALLTDLGAFQEADRIYAEALRSFQDVSPFPIAWIWFQRGMLWGELMTAPKKDEAVRAYCNAIVLVPGFVRARVHLAEILISRGRSVAAEELLKPLMPSSDPEVYWRLSDSLASRGQSAEAAKHMEMARGLFNLLLARHPLAFADHGAEFFGSSGADLHRALALACMNVENRPTMRAFQQALNVASEIGEGETASRLLADATRRWGDVAPFGEAIRGAERRAH
jgi:tetratricopeptide (TPR) repeat protein